MNDTDFEYGHHVLINLVLSSLALVVVNLNHWIEYQFAAIMWFIPSFGMTLLWYVDKYILKNSNTYTEIVVNRNIAYAIWMLCFTLLIIAGVAAAFMLYFSLKTAGAEALVDHARLGGAP